MTTLQLLATITAATFAAYVIAGVATYIALPAALRREPPTVVLILAWPVLWHAHDIAHNIIRAVEVGGDDRALLVTPRWLPMLLVGLVVVATILNHLGVV